jgi:hypothetical protein
LKVIARTDGYENLMKFINTYPETMISNRNQCCDFLPKVQVRTLQFKMHISYFLQNCKKGKPDEMDLPSLKNDITGSEPTFKILDT